METPPPGFATAADGIILLECIVILSIILGFVLSIEIGISVEVNSLPENAYCSGHVLS